MRAITDALHAGAFAFGGGAELVVGVTAKLVSPYDFLRWMYEVRFLRTSRLTGVIGSLYLYTETAPEDIYPMAIPFDVSIIRKALGDL